MFSQKAYCMPGILPANRCQNQGPTKLNGEVHRGPSRCDELCVTRIIVSSEFTPHDAEDSSNMKGLF
jgi:hypothetical protein